MTKKKEQWVWGCDWDDWSWEDGTRCRARSRKPVDSESKAWAGLDRHLNNCAHNTYRGDNPVGFVRRHDGRRKWV